VLHKTQTHVINHTSYKFFFDYNINVFCNKFHSTAYISHSSISKSWVKTQKGMSKHHRADNSEPSPVIANLEYEAPPPQDTGDDLPFDE
jgi:hypothetical protein